MAILRPPGLHENMRGRQGPMSFLSPGKGMLRFVPKPLRSPLQSIVDPVRGRLLWLERVADRLRPARIAATGRWLRHIAATIHARRRRKKVSVAIDASALWVTRTGIGWYLSRLLTELATREDLDLRLYGERLFIDPSAPTADVELPSGTAIDLVRYPVPDDLIIERTWLTRHLRRLEPLLIAADRGRVVFVPNFVPPPPFRFARGALVATVHDLTYKNFPRTLHDETLRTLSQHLDRTLARARLVLTDSHAVGSELALYGKCRPDALRVIHLGPRQVDVTKGQLPPSSPARYALHVGTFEPRKNLPMLLRAWQQLHLVNHVRLPLVLCGAPGWHRSELDALLSEGEAAGWLINLGFVSDSDLAAIYRHALFVCCPSLYEGFGLPVLEAMAAGTPVVASDIPVHREVAGDAAVLLKPDQPAEWAAAVAALAHDETRLVELAARGTRQAARFSWQRTAEQTAAAFIEAAS
jgi:O-antigen biosynthesis alpha-1,3-rhamnosyltransferase